MNISAEYGVEPRPGPPETVTLAAVRNARIAGGDDLVQLNVANGVIVRADRSGAAQPDAVLDADGALVSPGFVEPHVHLDKAFLVDRLRAADLPHGTLSEAMASTAALRPSFTRADIRSRAERLLGELAANGVCAARVHVEVEPTLGLLGVETHLDLRAEWAPAMQLQLVAFPQNGLSSAPGTAELLDEAMRMGCDVVGGCPYADQDEGAHIDQIFSLAEKWGVPIDFHLDFSDDPTRSSVDLVIERTIETGSAGRVTVGHLTSLAAMAVDDAARRADGLAKAGIHVVSLPQTDIFLGGRAGRVERPGSLTPIRQLIERGVNVCLGTNNVQNAFTPLGRSAPLTMAWLAGLASHLSEQAYLRLLLDMVTVNPARALGYQSWDLTPGAPADLVMFDTEDPSALVATGAEVLGAVHAGCFRPNRGPRHRLSICDQDV